MNFPCESWLDLVCPKGGIIFYHQGVPGIVGEYMNFGHQKGEQKKFTDPIPKKLKSQNINLY